MSYYNDTNGSIFREWESKVPLDGYEHVAVQTVNHMAKEDPNVFPNANKIVKTKAERLVIGGYLVLSNGRSAINLKPVGLIENGYPEREHSYIYLVENLSKCFATTDRRLIDPFNASKSRTFIEEYRPYDRFSSDPPSHYQHDIRYNHVVAGRDMVILNYTEEDIVVRDQDGFPRVYKPLTEEEGHGLEGEIVILESVFLDSPDRVGDPDTCFKHLAGVYSDLASINPKYKLLEKAYIAADMIWSKRRKEEIDPAGVRVTVSTIIKPNEVEMIQSGAGIYVPETGFLIQSRKIKSRYESPEFSRKINIISRDDRYEHYAFFMNDPGKVFGPKYVSLIGGSALVPVIDDPSSPPGFYYDELGIDGVKRLKYMDAGQIFNCPFLRGSYEEGLKGASIEEINKRRIEEIRIRGEERKEEHENRKRMHEFIELGKKLKRDELRWVQTQVITESKTDDFISALKTFASILAVTGGILTTLYKLAN